MIMVFLSHTSHENLQSAGQASQIHISQATEENLKALGEEKT